MLEDYFIGLPLPINVLLIIFALYVVMRSAHYLVDGAVSIAHDFRISPLIIGATVVAMGTTSAENAVNLVIVLSGEDTSIVVGNILGSNLVNFGIELGVSALIAGLIYVPRAAFEKDIPIYFAATGLLTAMTIDGLIQQSEGILLISLYLLAIGLVVQYARTRRRESVLLVEVSEMEAISHPDAVKLSRRQALFALFGGLFVLILASRLLIVNTTVIAMRIGIPEFIIGLVFIGPGTSIPEIASSLQAARRGHADLVLGTVFGSCLFNLLLGLGLPALFQPLIVGIEAKIAFLFINIINLSLLALILLDVSWLGRARTINRLIGGYLVAMYIGFISYQVFMAAGISISHWLIFLVLVILCAIGILLSRNWLLRRALATFLPSERRQRILCATRGGEASIPTHEKAIEMAKELGAELLFLYVFDQTALPLEATPLVINVEAQIRHMTNYLARTAQEQALRAGIESRIIVRVGSLREQLVSVAREQDVGLIILGNPAEKSSLFKREALNTLAADIEEATGARVLALLDDSASAE
jgi:cation:H+ antiporter